MSLQLFRSIGVALAIAVAAAGCASAPAADSASAAPAGVVAPRAAATEDKSVLNLGGAVADLAADMVGARYRLGGTDPVQGFDSSGLAFYAYDLGGYPIPRMPADQFRAAHKIALADATAGDLFFFQDQAKLSHVGIYLGDGLFVHAPETGRQVSVARIDAPYYQEQLIAVGRLLPPGL